MTVHNIEDTNVYARYLNEHPDEVQHLFKELLINVTSFFRDTEAFAVLKKDILPKMFEISRKITFSEYGRRAAQTGEEAYSIAMLFRECMDDLKKEFRIQIFGTDMMRMPLQQPAPGLSANIVSDVTPERLRRFFIKKKPATE